MAAKGSVVDKKRKASSSIKDKPKATSKKPRVEEKDEEMPDADADSFESFDDLSDSDDGGVKLDDDQEDSKQNGGKTFERGSHLLSLQAITSEQSPLTILD